MKIIDIEKEQFDSFTRKHKYRSFYQTSIYARIMPKFGYEVSYIGIYDDSESLIGASVLLLKEAFMKNKVAYAPRGILFDFTDASKTEELVETMKKDLGKKGIILLKMDPAIPLNIRDNKGNIVNVNNEANMVMTNLEHAGFNYKGQNIYFETEKPRWEALTILQRGDLREIYKSFDKRCRNKINKAIRCGVEIYRDEEKDLAPLSEFLKKNNKPLKYYREILASFGKNADLFYARLNTEQFVLNSKKLYEDELDKNAKIAEQFQDLSKAKEDRRELFNKKVLSDKLLTVYKNNMIFATNILKTHPEGLIIAGGINIVYDNAAFSIVEAYNDKYKSLNPHYLLKWRMISDYYNEKLKYFNMEAISGDFNSKGKYAGLNDSKLGYNSTITEYIGEYEIVLNNMKYGIYKNIKK